MKGYQSSTAQPYVAHLKRLIKSPEITSGLGINDDPPILVLARLYQKCGDALQARRCLWPLARRAFSLCDLSDDPRDGYSQLAHILIRIDDDVNAVAAWKLLCPDRPAEEGEQLATDPVGDIGKEPFEQAPPVGTFGFDDSEDSAVAGAVRSDDIGGDATNPTLGPSADSSIDHDAVASKVPKQSVEENDQAPEGLTGFLRMYCDGLCGRRWRFTDEMYVCKDCVDVQLDPGCFERLRSNNLTPGICSRDHEHLYIPPFNYKAWMSADQDMMEVGDAWMSKREWLRRLQGAWDVPPLDRFKSAADNVRKGQRVWRALEKRRASQAQVPNT
jgi:hypothetical protein